MEMKEVVIIRMGNTTEIEFLSKQLISLTQQLHTLRRWVRKDKRPHGNAITEAYKDIRKDIRLIRRALTGKFNIIEKNWLQSGELQMCSAAMTCIYKT